VSIFGQPQAVLEIAQERLATAQAAEGAEVGFALYGAEENAHPLEEIVASEIARTRSTNGGIEQVLLFERRRVPSQAPQLPANAIQRPDGKRPVWWGK